MNFITGDYDRSTVASTSDFEQLELEVLVPMEGYMLIYVSNEEEQANIAYFDDISITHNHSPVIQENAYYPFGLQHASSYQRSYSTKQNFKYNGFEEQMEWGVYDYQARYYDPALGKFLNIDPAADLMRRHSPYNYAFDNPIRFIDPDGMMPGDVVKNEDCCPDTQSPQAAFNGALGKLESLFNTAVKNISDVAEATAEFLTPEKIEVEKEAPTKKEDSGLKDGVAEENPNGSEPSGGNGPNGSGSVSVQPDVQGAPDIWSRALTLGKPILETIFEFADPEPPKPIEGDSVDVKWRNHLNGNKVQTKRVVKLTNGYLGSGRWLDENEESNK